MTNKRVPMKAKVNEIIKKAEANGASNSFFFLTTFQRYQVQLDTLTKLERAIKKHGPMVVKEYVKGRENLCINPAITEYNKTATAANNTVSTLVKIVDAFRGEEKTASLDDVMAELMNNE